MVNGARLIVRARNVSNARAYFVLQARRSVVTISPVLEIKTDREIMPGEELRAEFGSVPTEDDGVPVYGPDLFWSTPLDNASKFHLLELTWNGVTCLVKPGLI